VAAVDIRQSEFTQVRLATNAARAKIAGLKTDAEKRAVSAELEKFKQALSDESTLRLYEDYQKGSVLALYFAEQLKGMEDSGFDVASSLREMMAAFDPAKESARVVGTADARARAVAARKARKENPQVQSVIAENPLTTHLLEIQKLIEAGNYAKAGADLKQLLAQNPNDPRVLFTIGRLAGLSAVAIQDEDAQAKRLLEAKEAYGNVLKNSTGTTDKALLSLTYVALGRIYEYFSDPAYAAKLYDQSIKIGDITGGGFKEAIAAKHKLIKPN
ncbi:MAG: hypothetical protein ABIV21_06980, partial [Pyrinomonadaceae bacterium]